MEKDEDFLAAVEADNQAETPEAVEQPTEATPEAEAPQGQEPPLELTEVAEPKNVPLSALLDERDRRKAEADRATLLEEQVARLTQGQQQPQTAPDPLEDPEGFGAYISQQVQMNTVNATLNMSEAMARQAHGDETVNAAQQWAKQKLQSDPGYQQRIAFSPNPYAMVLADYQRETALTKLGDATGIDEFIAWKAAQRQLTASPTPAAPPAAPQQPPPRSIASAPSAGGVSSAVIPTEDEMFEEVMKAK